MERFRRIPPHTPEALHERTFRKWKEKLFPNLIVAFNIQETTATRNKQREGGWSGKQGMRQRRGAATPSHMLPPHIVQILSLEAQGHFSEVFFRFHGTKRQRPQDNCVISCRYFLHNSIRVEGKIWGSDSRIMNRQSGVKVSFHPTQSCCL